MDNNGPLLYEKCENGSLSQGEFSSLSSGISWLNQQYDWTPLHVACYKGHLSVVELLVNNGADVNIPNGFNQTPLHAASWGGHPEIVEFLLKKGADINSCDNEGQSALIRATLSGCSAAVEILLQNNAELVSESGDSALDIASQCKNNHLIDVMTKALNNTNPTLPTSTTPTIQPSSVHPQNDSSVHPQKDSSVHPQSNSSVHPQKDSSVHPQKDSSVHPQNNSSVHPQKDSSVHPQSDSSQEKTISDIIASDSIFKRMQSDSTQSIGLPLSLFPPNYGPSCDDVHKSISFAMSDHWTPTIATRFEDKLNEFVDNSVLFQETKDRYDLTLDEALAITYYTSDAEKLNFDSSKNSSPYFTLNKVLASRNTAKLEQWKSFLYYLLRGLQKLEPKSTRVYRAIDTPLLSNPNTQYKQNATVVWIAFTSTSQSSDQLKEFAEATKKGTWLILDVCEGRDISPFSLFPKEEEVLLLPNSYFKVEARLTEGMKAALNINVCVDVLELKQQPTPEEYRNYA